MACKELVQRTLVLKIIYENTSTLLETLFARFEKSDIENFNITDNENTDNYVDVPDIFCKEEIDEEFNNGALFGNGQVSCATAPESHFRIKLNEASISKKILKTTSQINPRITEKTYKKIIERGYPETDQIKFSTNQTSRKTVGKPLNNQFHLCPICKQELPTSLDLRQHAHLHRILGKYLSKGKRISTTAKFFAKPRETDTIFNGANILHKCMFCIENIPIENFKNHISDHFIRGEFSCYKCDRIFRKLGHLNAHVTIMHLEELPYQCDKCEKRFTIKYNYDCHLVTHTNPPNELPHKCERCEKKFANKVLLKRHRFRHTDQGSLRRIYKINKCKNCLRTFENFDNLQEHNKSKCDTVTKVIPPSRRFPRKYTRKPDIPNGWMCDICPKTFNRAGTLWAHKRTSHGEPKKKVLCALCGASVVYLKQHMKSHEPKKIPVECHICHKKLATKLTLIKHIRTHTGERPYPCKFCEKRFKDIHSKRVHERIHEGVKKHICPVCGKGFLEKAYMLKHLRGVHK